jgi:hypothetical protein
MQADDPFAAPSSLVGDPAGSSGTIPPGVVETLRRTKGWVRFLAILGFVAAGLTLVMGLVFGGLGLAGSSAFAETEASMPVPPAAMFFGYAVLMCFIGVIYIFPSWRLLRYAGAIARLEAVRDGASLESALEQQRAFWRLVGIIAIATGVLYGLLMVGAVAAGMMAAFRSAGA